MTSIFLSSKISSGARKKVICDFGWECLCHRFSTEWQVLIILLKLAITQSNFGHASHKIERSSLGDDRKSYPKIVGGNSTVSDEYPSMVGFLDNSSSSFSVICGCSINDRNYVTTSKGVWAMLFVPTYWPADRCVGYVFRTDIFTFRKMEYDGRRGRWNPERSCRSD